MAMSVISSAQSASQPTPPEVRAFQPLSLPGQQRPIVIPKPPLLSKQGQMYGVMGLLLLLILAGTLALCWKNPSIIARILIVLGALGVSGFVVFVSLTMIGLTATPDNSKAGIARRALAQMGEHLGMSKETIAAILEDDECRIGLLLGGEALAIVDYGENKGLLAPYANLDSVVSHEGRASELPPLNSPALADQWIVETHAARQSSDTTRLKQLEWYFHGPTPKAVIVRFVQSDYFFQETASIAAFCRQRMEEAQ